jgi:hypothetical protein
VLHGGGLDPGRVGPGGAIIYGQFDGNRHPNVGTMVVDIDGDKFSICSGTLIDSDTFLTASQCTAFPEQVLGTDQVWVSFDPVFDPDTSKLFPGTTHTHPEFGFSGPGGFSDAHDIAVIELDAPVAGITPAQLPTEGLLDDLKAGKQLKSATFTAVGYGTVRETRKMAWQSIQDKQRAPVRPPVVQRPPPALAPAVDERGHGRRRHVFRRLRRAAFPRRGDLEPARVDHGDR